MCARVCVGGSKEETFVQFCNKILIKYNMRQLQRFEKLRNIYRYLFIYVSIYILRTKKLQQFYVGVQAIFEMCRSQQQSQLQQQQFQLQCS